MGFFSSRKDDPSTVNNDDTRPKVVQVIRSRFYGKGKGKEKEDPDVSFSTSPSAAQALSPVARRPTTVRRTQRPATTYEAQSGSASARPATVYDISSQSSPSTSRFLEPTPPTPPPKRPPLLMPKEQHRTTDSVTVTLAQRLDELAKANSDGLLNDEEYRMLRKDLFERFASTSSVPVEAALVPSTLTTRPRAGTNTSTSRSSLAPSRPSSQFHVDTARTPSVHSKGSVSSGMTSFFSRRTTDTRPRSNSKDQSETSSVFSTQSTLSNTFKLSRLLSRKTSQSSVGTESQADAMSISSRRTDSNHDRLPHFSPSVARSTASSIRRMATPPSAFPSRINTSDTSSSSTFVGVTNIFDESNLTTSHDIRKEILAVESEKRRLMDSFNSLELRLLTQSQRKGLAGREAGGDVNSSSMSFRTVERSERLRRRALENDTLSIRSGLSASPSLARSTASWKTQSVRADSLRRKNSNRTLEEVPPLPAFPSKMSGYLGVPATPSHSGHSSGPSSSADNSSFLTLDTLPEDDPPSLNDEMDEIKRRREEVAARYDARVEYLQAKLKGAQLHEKLLRK